MRDVDASSEFSEQDIIELRELDHIYKKLVVKNTKSAKYPSPTHRTLLPGAHVRKLGIRLKTAKQFSEKPQTASSTRRHLRSAQPRVSVHSDSQMGTAQENIIQIDQPGIRNKQSDITPLRAGTAYPMTSGREPYSAADRKCAKSAPVTGMRVSNSFSYSTGSRVSPRLTVSQTPINNSLALYSPQTQRFTIEQLAREQTRLLKRLSHIQTHRVDQKFYVAGTHFDPRERYDIDDEQYKLLLEITNRNKRTDNKIASLRLSQKLQQFTPNPAQYRETHPSKEHTNTHKIPSPREDETTKQEATPTGEPNNEEHDDVRQSPEDEAEPEHEEATNENNDENESPAPDDDVNPEQTHQTSQGKLVVSDKAGMNSYCR